MNERRLLVVSLLGLAACEDDPGRLSTDASFDGPRDLGSDGCPGAGCDAATDAGPQGCTPESPVLVTERAPSLGRGYSAVATLTGHHAVLVARDAAGTGHELLAISHSVAGVTSTSSLGALTTPATDGVSLVPTAAGFVLFHGDGGDVFARVLGADLTPVAGALSLRTGSADERLLAATSTTTGFALIISVDGTPTLVPLDATLASAGADVPLPALITPAFLALANPRAAFVDSNGYVAAVPLASPAAAPTVWSALGRVVDFEVASAFGEGGLVYESTNTSLRHVAQFRAIDAAGTVTYAERGIAGAFAQAFEPSIAPAGGGYFVLYRHDPDDATPTSLRLAAISTFGDPVSHVDLAVDVRGPTRSAVRTAVDGRVSASFEVIEARDAGDVAAVYAARLLCD